MPHVFRFRYVCKWNKTNQRVNFDKKNFNIQRKAFISLALLLIYLYSKQSL